MTHYRHWDYVHVSATEHLNEINAEASLLDDEQKEYFHATTAKLLFLCQRARPELQEAVSFLMTRVMKPDVDDWKKLKR